MSYNYDRRKASEAGLKKAIIRLAYEKPELRPHLLPLVKQASRRLDSDMMETLQLIHESRRVRHSWEGDVSRAYTILNNAGEGYGVGEEDDDISSISGSTTGRSLSTGTPVI